MNMVATDLLLGPLEATFLIGITSLIFLYWYSVRNHDYWKKRGIPTARTVPFLGSLLDVYTKPLHELEVERLKKLGRIYGQFEGNKPVLSVAEPALLRQIFVKDFQVFPSRREFDFGDEILNRQVSQLEGEDWKRVRNIMTPTFTTGKLRRMLGIFNDCSKALIENFRKTKGKPAEVRKLYAAFAMDIVASAAFSTKIDSHNNPDNEFVKAANDIFNQFLNWRFFLFFAFPRLMRLLGYSAFSKKSVDFFKDVTVQIIEEREKTGQTRNDFLQLLMDTTKELSKENKLTVPEEEIGDIASNYGDAGQLIYKNVTSKHLSMNELVAQSASFFFAGFDATATNLALSSYLLAIHTEVQDKLRTEVDKAIEEAGGVLTYDSMYKMKYLDNVISETLRIYPPVLSVERRAVSDYKLGDTGITIPKGMVVMVPVFSLHRDPEYFPDPEKFDPERFSTEERAKRDQYAYLPFGAGPRNCVGMRFILMEVKVCLATIVSHFIIKRCPQTKVPLEFQKNPALLTPKDVILQMEPRMDSPFVK